ncbi:DUF2271 domain-containing protein [Haliscomenobacter sp.]|uniref:DUF2271 domain-containing protein n=1 Tax=Haliscomenobacter sp. TaxID=2717303 RepID=UPI003593F5B3
MNKSNWLKLSLGGVLIFSILLGFGFKNKTQQVSLKCLIQLTNYTGEGAYAVVSLIDSKGKYKKTLQVFGKESRWYDDIVSWYKFHTTQKEQLDGISGASITVGTRKVFSLSLDDAYFNKGYRLRFETAVENQDYKEKDVEMDFSEANVGKTVEGTGYIRYVKLIKGQ